MTVWSGNVATRSGTSEPVVFDACSFYGHNEADFGIAVMFSGVSKPFFEAYHEVIPKLEPYYEERQQLYELYHQLNHAALCKHISLNLRYDCELRAEWYAVGGGGYASGASRIMSKLLAWEKSLKK